MKRQEAFDRMRKNRDTARVLEMRRQSETRRIEHEARVKSYAEADRKHKEAMARFDDYERMARILTQAACMPFMAPSYYTEIKDQVTRLGNEYGIRADKPRRELKVVGGKP